MILDKLNNNQIELINSDEYVKEFMYKLDKEYKILNNNINPIVYKSENDNDIYFELISKDKRAYVNFDLKDKNKSSYGFVIKIDTEFLSYCNVLYTIKYTTKDIIDQIINFIINNEVPKIKIGE